MRPQTRRRQNILRVTPSRSQRHITWRSCANLNKRYLTVTVEVVRIIPQCALPLAERERKEASGGEGRRSVLRWEYLSVKAGMATSHLNMTIRGV